MNSAPDWSERLKDMRKELLTLALGIGVLTLLSVSGLLNWLLASEADLIIAGLVLLGAVVVVLGRHIGADTSSALLAGCWFCTPLLDPHLRM